MSNKPDSGHRHSTSTFTQSISDAIHGLGRTLSGDHHGEEKERSISRGREGAPADLAAARAASRSRGRDPLMSTGRGGAGNIIHSPERTGPDASDLDTIEKARERSASRLRSAGRGGAGNMGIPNQEHSQSRGDRDFENQVIQNYAAEQVNVIHSSGRGGAGNIVGSRSPSRNPGSAPGSAPGSRNTSRVRSSGRGGAGNLYDEESFTQSLGVAADKLDTPAHVPSNNYSTGRGGAANVITPSENITEPGIERHAHEPGNVESSGRGGAGNMVQTVKN